MRRNEGTNRPEEWEELLKQSAWELVVCVGASGRTDLNCYYFAKLSVQLSTHQIRPKWVDRGSHVLAERTTKILLGYCPLSLRMTTSCLLILCPLWTEQMQYLYNMGFLLFRKAVSLNRKMSFELVILVIKTTDKVYVT